MHSRNPAASAEAAELVRVDDPDIRILRRVQPLHNWPVLAEPEEPFIRVAALDFETTGFDPDCDVIIDCAVALLLVDQTGRIVEIEDVYEGLQDPGFELPQEITAVTGLRDQDVVGQELDLPALASVLARADLLLSHNAFFDRPFCERLLPSLEDKCWACSIRDADWLAWGFDGAKLGHLLAQCGQFNPSVHRAMDDVVSLVHVVSHVLPSGRTVLSHILEKARRPTWRLAATGAPFHLKHHLKRRGYRWNPKEQVWSIELSGEAAEAEERWYREEFLPHGPPPTITRLTARERYR